MAETLITVDKVSKKFCKDFKRSLWYGVKDLASEVMTFRSERHDLRKQEFWAVKDVSFQLKRGEVLGLIGPNGAGKTTLLRLLNGLVKPDEGRITVRGRVGALIELNAGFNPILTGRENIYVTAAILGIPKKEIDKKLDDIIEFAGIGDFIGAPVQSYSSGMRVRLGFSVAINLQPDIMLIDEVLAVGDFAFRNKCLEAIRRIRESGVAFIFVSHNLGQVHALCDRAIYVKDGQVRADGSTEKAISAYATDGSDREARFTQDPHSTEHMVVRDVQFLNEIGAPTDQMTSGHPLTIRVTFEARHRLDAPLFTFQVLSDGAELIAAAFNQERDEHRPSFSPGLHTIDFTIKRFPLLAGRYQLRMALVGPDVLTIYVRNCNIGAIKVVMRDGQLLDSNRSGLIELECDWRVLSEADTVRRAD